MVYKSPKFILNRPAGDVALTAVGVSLSIYLLKSPGHQNETKMKLKVNSNVDISFTIKVCLNWNVLTAQDKKKKEIYIYPIYPTPPLGQDMTQD